MNSDYKSLLENVESNVQHCQAVCQYLVGTPGMFPLTVSELAVPVPISVPVPVVLMALVTTLT